MKIKGKVNIFISAITAILFSSTLLIEGTYALFVNENKNDISITSGKVDVRSLIHNIYAYSPTSISPVDGSIIDSTNAATNDESTNTHTFYNGGKVVVDGSSVHLINISSGDYVQFSIKVTNHSNIKTQYRTYYEITNNADGSASDDDLVNALKIYSNRTIIDKSTGWFFLKQASDPVSGELISDADSTWRIQLPSLVSSSLGGKSCTISFVVEALQGNAKTFFDGGDGSVAKPFLINDASSFEKINYYRDKYTYFKVGVSELDLTSVKPIYLYGTFDGNNALIKGNNSLFYTAGYNSSTETTVIKNFTANLNSANSLVFSLFGASTTFENVKISGTIMGSNNVGAFLNYGTAIWKASNYEINFTNCYCDADIIATAQNYASILIGHAYQGVGNDVNINIDSGTYEGISNANVYAVGSTNQGRRYFGLSYGNTPVVRNDNVIVNDNVYSAHQIKVINPTKNSDGSYIVNKDNNVDSISVKINSSLTAYDDAGEAIEKLKGITFDFGNLYTQTKSLGTDSYFKIADALSSISISNKMSGLDRPTFALDSSALEIITNTLENYQTGKVYLHVRQFDVNNKLLAVGSLTIAQRNDLSSSWAII